MDLLPIGFLLALVLISGGIALAADELGRKLGKKRLSFCGLRPKHTAKLGTFALGVMVSLFSIIFVSLLSGDVRQWILEGRQAIHDRDAKIRELNSADSQLREDQQLEKTLRVKIQSLQEARQNEEGQLAREDNKLRQAQARTQQLEKQESELQSRLRLTDLQIRDKDRLISEKQASLIATQSKLQALQRRFGEQQRNYAAKINQSLTRSLTLNEKNQELQTSIAEKESTLQSLTAEKNKLIEDKTNLEADKTKLNEELESTQHELNEMSARSAEVQQNLSNLRQEAAEMESRLSRAQVYLDSVVGPSRELRMTFGRGQEVARLSVPDHLSTYEAQTALEHLLTQARAIAETRGARSRGNYPTADILNQDKTADERKAQLVQDLTGKPNALVLIATADINAFEGEPVSLAVDIKENPWVFKKGEIVAESRIDGAQPPGEIYQAMERFLGNSILTKAKERHMITDPIQDSPVPQEEFMQTLMAIKQAGHSVRLRAIASDDTHAADPLKLDFQVR